MALTTYRDGPVNRRLNIHRDWRYDIPLKFLWAVYIYPRVGSYNQLGVNIDNVIQKYETFQTNQWPVNIRCLDEVTDPFGNFGILLAQQVALPSDAFEIGSTNIDGVGGKLGGQYAGNRQGYGGSNKLDITFLETNIDIFDYFFRPWIIANSYKGLIEDGNESEDLKCNIQLVQFSRDAGSYRDVFVKRSTLARELTIRKVVEFYDVAPFQINGDSLSYGDLSISDILKTVSFSFNRYSLIDKNSIPIQNGI